MNPMNSLLYYIFLGLGSFLFSLLATRVTILALRRKQALLDVPNARSNHKIPTPRGGGIAVVMALAVFLMIADVSYLVIFGLLLLAAISLLDDIIRLSPLTRLLTQVLAVLPALYALPISPTEGGLVPPWLLWGMIGVLWIWFINLFNFMDGIDGISGVEMTGIAVGILAVLVLGESLASPLWLYALITLGAGFGFLWWNWHPARIFLGDVGSIPIGFILGYLLLSLAAEGYPYAAMILPAYYLADATVTLMRRAFRGEKVWEAHSEHFYQQAVRGGRSHDQVAREVAGVNLLLMLLAGLSAIDDSLGWIYLCIAYGMVFAVMLYVFARPQEKQEARRN